MSLLDTASLLLTPNAYKEGKLYSVIPSDGSGDFTFTRATTATRVNSAGLVELVPYNLVSYSEQFDNAYWQKLNGGIGSIPTVTANTATSPDGTLTADRIQLSLNGGTSGSDISYINANVSTTAATFSIYAKSNTTPCTIYFRSGSTVTTINITTEWQRFEIYRSGAITVAQFGLRGGSEGGAVNSNTADISVWGAQLVEGTNALPYQKTETRLNIPRLDYSLGGCPNILLEPQRTNLALQSSSFDNTTTWTNGIGGTGVNPIRTANTTISPSGVQDADTIVFDRGAGNTLSDQSIIGQQITIATTGTYYFSVWLKATASGDIGKQVFIRCGNAAALQAVTLTANWVRYETTSSVTAGSNGFQVGSRGTITTSNSVSVDLWGAQLEAGSYATSYIGPTTTASVTRNQDLCSKTGISSLIGQTEGTLFVDFVYNHNDFNAAEIISISDATTSNRVYIGNVFDDNLTCNITSSSSVQFTSATSFALVVGQRYKAALSYKLNDFVFYVNGSQIATDNSGTVPLMSRFGFDSGSGASTFYKPTNAAALWKERLTNDQLAQLTTI